MTSVRSIETEFHGIVYRSRTEARWAAFFKSEQIPFRYEEEGFDMGGLRYVPDFWLEHARCWFEVKPFDPLPSEMEKARRLARATRRLVFIAPGAPKAGIGIHAVSPNGAAQKNWQFAYAHEEGVGYLCDDLWVAKHEIRLRSTRADAGMYGSGPEEELNAAGALRFGWRA